MTTMTSREFNQDTGRAKREAETAPVIITDRGKPSHVLMDYATYTRLRSGGKTLFDALYHPESADIELEIPPRRIEPDRPLDLED